MSAHASPAVDKRLDWSLASGRHEAPGRQLPAQEWFEQLRAPAKDMTHFETSGHRPLWEQPARFHDLMTDVLIETAATR